MTQSAMCGSVMTVVMTVTCVCLVICTVPPATAIGNGQKLAAKQHLTGQAVYGPSIIAQITLSSTLAGQPGCHVGPALYGLRPLWSCIAYRTFLAGKKFEEKFRNLPLCSCQFQMYSDFFYKCNNYKYTNWR
jgi:hypothetical protein